MENTSERATLSPVIIAPQYTADSNETQVLAAEPETADATAPRVSDPEIAPAVIVVPQSVSDTTQPEVPGAEVETVPTTQNACHPQVAEVVPPGTPNTPQEGGRTDAPTVSQRKLDANRANAEKSTGPRTPAGKAKSRFNAVKHGLLAKQLMFSEQGQPQDESLHVLVESLSAKYGTGDVVTELLIEGIVADYWRGRAGLALEIDCIGRKAGRISIDFIIGNLHRYNIANHRSLIKSLEILEKLGPEKKAAEKIDASLGEE
jgi:hypothetical protein